MKSRRLILIKHSMPLIDEQVSAGEWLLSEDGKRKSEQLARVLSDIHTQTIYCSEEPKAVQTAEELAKIWGTEVVQKKGLHEHDRKDVRFMPRGEFVETMKKFFYYPHALIFGHETANEAKNRYKKAVNDIMNEAPEDQDVVIVAHGTVNTLFVSEYNEINHFEFWSSLDLPSYVELTIPNYELVRVVEKI